MVKKYSQKSGMRHMKKFSNSPTKPKKGTMVSPNAMFRYQTRIGNPYINLSRSSSSNSSSNSWKSDSQSNNTESNIAREEARRNKHTVIYQNAKDLIDNYSSKSENDLRYFTLEQFKTIIEDILFGLHGIVFEDFEKSGFRDTEQYIDSYYEHIQISILNFLDDNELKTLHKLLQFGYNKTFANKRNNDERFKDFFNYLNTIVMHKYNYGKTAGFITPLIPKKKHPQVSKRPTKRRAPPAPPKKSKLKRPTLPEKPKGLLSKTKKSIRTPSLRTPPSRTPPSRRPSSRTQKRKAPSPPSRQLIIRPRAPSSSTKPKLSNKKNNSSNYGKLTELQKALKKRGISIVI